MRMLLLYSFLPIVVPLKCTDMIIGNNNGTTFNFRNTLRCPETTKWCMSINGSFYSPQFSIDGRMGNCETNGFIGAFVERAKPIDLSCKEAGCVDFVYLNVTRCCCNTDHCNAGSINAIAFSLLLLMVINL